jgi:hypothetical protein
LINSRGSHAGNSALQIASRFSRSPQAGRAKNLPSHYDLLLNNRIMANSPLLQPPFELRPEMGFRFRQKACSTNVKGFGCRRLKDGAAGSAVRASLQCRRCHLAAESAKMKGADSAAVCFGDAQVL